MYDHILRHPKTILLQPVARRLRVSPNRLTGLGLLFGLLSGLFCAFGFFRSAMVAWLVNRFLDGLDGEVARAQNKQTDLGGYVDILADLLVYAFLPIGIAFHGRQAGLWQACSVMLASFYFNVGTWMYLSSILEKLGMGAEEMGEKTTVVMPRGLIEGGETILFFTVFLLYPFHCEILFWSFALLTFLGAFLRVRWAHKTLLDLSLGT